MQLLTVFLSGSLIDLDGTIFIQLGLFFIAFLILRATIFGPVIRLFETREESIEGAVRKARAMSQEAADAEAEFQAEMRKARAKASEERDRLRSEGQKLEASLVAKVRTETQKLLLDADRQLTKEAHKVRDDMATVTPVLARQIASKLLQREVS